MQHKLRYRAARRATIVNSTTNALLAFFKVILGYIGNSQALLADGIHSFSDLITDAIVLIATKVGTHPPDKEHPYGHQRVETVATIIIALVLIGAAVGIGYDALHHIIMHTKTIKPSFFVIIVAAVSIIANEFLYHYTMYEGNKVNSDLLRSNAWHNRSDTLVSIIVLVSVIGALLGAHYLDAIGALIIGLLIFKMSIKMIWTSLRELIDTGVEEKLHQQITEHILKTPNIIAIHQLRTRSHGNNIFLDVHIQVDPHFSVSEGHYISEQVIISLKKSFEKIIDVTVHIDPEDDQKFILSKDLPKREDVLSLLKDHCQSLPRYAEIQKVVLHYLNGKLIIELYLPISTYSKDLEERYQKAISDVAYIHHIYLYFH
jgi:cation diffusion facilitator family transporter